MTIVAIVAIVTLGRPAQPSTIASAGFRSRRIADVAVYPRFLTRTGDHLFTCDKAEADLRESEGWADEGVAPQRGCGCTSAPTRPSPFGLVRLLVLARRRRR